MRRRRGGSRGFAMAEALVALAIAALTLSLLTSASWGLRMVSERRAALEATSAVDWLAARRAVQTWAIGISATGHARAGVSLTGTATNARMIVSPRGASTTGIYGGELRVARLASDAGVGEAYVLYASRHDGLRDARVASDTPRTTEVLRSRAPIRLLYLLPDPGRAAMVWRYETGDGEALPAALAVEAGDRRMITVPILPTRSASCLSELGPGGLEEPECALR